MDSIALAQSLGHQMAQVTFASEMFRRVEYRIMQFAELDFQIAFFSDFYCILHCFRRLGEPLFHLFSRTKIKLLLGVAGAHPFRIAQHRLGANADQAIVCVRVAFLDVMHVICRHQFQPEFLCPRNQMPIDLRLLGNAVVLQFEIKVLRPQRLFKPINGRARFGQLILLNPFRNFARQAA